MKKITLIAITFILLIVNITVPVTAQASAPYKTYTIGPNDNAVETQTAYEPVGVLSLEAALPEDLFIDDNDILYIADTGNSRILVMEEGGTKVIGEGILNSPTGVYSQGDSIYVADGGNKRIYVFDKSGGLQKEIGRPEEPLYGKNTDFVPRKLTVDKRGNIYVIGEGAVNGIIQLNSEGGFTGYFGSNKTRTTFKMILQRTLFTEGQLGQLFKNIPASPTNVVIDSSGLIYSATYGISENPIKKFNVSGRNILEGKLQADNKYIVDLAVDKLGNIFGIDATGNLAQFDSYGNLLFIFGGRSEEEILGLVRNPAAIDLDEQGRIYVLDREKAVIQLYEATDFAKEVNRGVALYKEGLYLESKEIWEGILRLNSSFILSYEAVAKAYMKEGKSQQALDAFRLAEDKDGYSDAFWEIRNQWLQEYLAVGILILIGLMIILKIIKAIFKRFGILDGKLKFFKAIKEYKHIKELIYIKKFLRKPIDSFYEIKRMNTVSIGTSTIMVIWLVVLRFTGIYFKGYLFINMNLEEVNLIREAGIILVPFLLWVIANYMIASINEGEGSLKDVYNGTIYALSPYLLGMLPLQLLTNVITYNESFIYELGTLVIYLWCAVLLFLMVKEIHDYTASETIKVILLTFFGMMVIVLLIIIVYILVDHQWDFLDSIIQELKLRG
ncbi:MAG: YIP1 family protein [Clostridiaceae bacterium]